VGVEGFRIFRTKGKWSVLVICALSNEAIKSQVGNPVAAIQLAVAIKKGKEVTMTRTILSCLPILLMGAMGAHADLLDFNALQLGEEVQGYYNGGFGSMGTGPGPNFGITFTNDFVTVADGVFGPPLRAEELTSGSGIMDVAVGFSGPFSFYYKNSGAGGAANLYSGLDGGGSLVGTLLLPTMSSFAATGLITGVPFRSVVFTGSANTLVFDNITFGALVIPEPASISLLFIVLAALGFVCRNRIGGRATH
jgi:hypothetical protein